MNEPTDEYDRYLMDQSDVHLLAQFLLSEFFGAYFHQDWMLDSDDPDTIIAGYLRTVSEQVRRRVAAAIREYAARYCDDKELEERLFSDLGCEYLPSADGQSARSWLAHVVGQLDKSA